MTTDPPSIKLHFPGPHFPGPLAGALLLAGATVSASSRADDKTLENEERGLYPGILIREEAPGVNFDMKPLATSCLSFQ